MINSGLIGREKMRGCYLLDSLSSLMEWLIPALPIMWVLLCTVGSCREKIFFDAENKRDVSVFRYPETYSHQ